MEINSVKLIRAGFINPEEFALFEFSEYNKFMSISRDGGLKFIFRNNPQPFYISKKYFNTYEIVAIGKIAVMVFTEEFDVYKAWRIYQDAKVRHLIDEIESLHMTLEKMKRMTFSKKVVTGIKY